MKHAQAPQTAAQATERNANDIHLGAGSEAQAIRGVIKYRLWLERLVGQAQTDPVLHIPISSVWLRLSSKEVAAEKLSLLAVSVGRPFRLILCASLSHGNCLAVVRYHRIKK